MGKSIVDRSSQREIAQVLEKQQATMHVLRTNMGCGYSDLLERTSNRNERPNILGQMGNTAIGHTVPDRRPVRHARRVHENVGRVIHKNTCVSAWGGVALQISEASSAPSISPEFIHEKPTDFVEAAKPRNPRSVSSQLECSRSSCSHF